MCMEIFKVKSIGDRISGKSSLTYQTLRSKGGTRARAGQIERIETDNERAKVAFNDSCCLRLQEVGKCNRTTTIITG